MYSAKELVILSILNTYKEINSSFLYKLFDFSLKKEINLLKIFTAYNIELEEFFEKEKIKKILNFCNENLLEKLKLEADKVFRICEKEGINCLFYNENSYPRSLKNIKNPPYVLFIKGKLPEEKILQNSVALVGTRNLSLKGEEFTKNIAKYLKENNIFNISGLALGTDTLGHIGTLGLTGAVLGEGLAQEIYPRENKKLAENILKNNGFLISELPPKEKISVINLIRRNRLQAALSTKLIIAETDIKGGTVHTFKYAREQKKEIYIAEHNIAFIEKHRKDLIIIKNEKDFKKKIKSLKKQSKIKF